MHDFVRHYVVGNDAPPWAVALTRGVLEAVITGLLSFLAIWQTTDEVKTLIIAGATPALLVLSGRFVVEGMIDQRKNGGSG